MCEPAGRLVKRKAGRRGLSLGILEQAAKIKDRHSAPGRRCHRLHVNSGQQLRIQISLDKSSWLCYAQLSFRFCGPHPNNRYQCEFCFSLLVTPGSQYRAHRGRSLVV